MLVDMIWVMMNLKNYVENHGKRILIIFVLIDLKRKIKEDIVFVMKAKTLILNVFLKRNLFNDVKCCIRLKIEKIS